MGKFFPWMGTAFFSTPRVIITTVNERFQRTLQTKLQVSSPQPLTTFLPLFGQAGTAPFLCMCLHTDTYVHTSGCNGNKISINKLHYMYELMYEFIVITRLIKKLGRIKMYDSICVSMIVAGGLERGKSGKD